MYLVEDNPETNLSTEYYNRFVDSLIASLNVQKLNTAKRKIYSIDNFEISNNVGSIKMEFCKIEIR